QVRPGVLLELRRGVRRGRFSLLLALRDLGDVIASALEARPHRGSRVAVLDFELLAVGLDEAADETRTLLAYEAHADVPVLFRNERFDLALAIDDEPKGDRLHATGGEAERELRPDEGRDVVADDAIEDAARALRVVEVVVELARVRDAVLDTLLGDLVEL